MKTAVAPTFRLAHSSFCILPSPPSARGAGDEAVKAAIRPDRLALAGLKAAGALVSCPTLLLTTRAIAATPSPGPPRLVKAPAARHPLPQGHRR